MMTDYFWEVVLKEDDCAPDAREYFNREFRQYSALDVATFKSLAQHKESNDGLTLSWVLGGVELSISADDPFYIVKKRRVVSPKSDMNSTKEPSDPIRAASAPAGDHALRDAALLALTTLEGWANHDEWTWPVSALEQAKRDTTEAVASLETALSRPATPPTPAAGEVAELVVWLHTRGREGLESGLKFAQENGRQLTRAAALLEQLSAQTQAVVPVAVSERLPELDVRCWWFDNNKQWYFRSWEEINIAGLQQPTHWLPAHAIPLPQRLNK